MDVNIKVKINVPFVSRNRLKYENNKEELIEKLSTQNNWPETSHNKAQHRTTKADNFFLFYIKTKLFKLFQQKNLSFKL